MKAKTALFALMLTGCSASVLAQSDFSTDGDQRVGQQTAIPPGSVAIPESVMLRYARGEAPFFVEVRSYARKLDRAVSRQIEALQKVEIDSLGISLPQLEEIHSILEAYRGQLQSYWGDSIATKCRDVSLNQLADADAKAFLADIDNREEALNALANEALTKVASAMGQEVHEKLLARIKEAGTTVEYTRVDEVARIELMEGGEYTAYIARQCEVL